MVGSGRTCVSMYNLTWWGQGGPVCQCVNVQLNMVGLGRTCMSVCLCTTLHSVVKRELCILVNIQLYVMCSGKTHVWSCGVTYKTWMGHQQSSTNGASLEPTLTSSTPSTLTPKTWWVWVWKRCQSSWSGCLFHPKFVAGAPNCFLWSVEILMYSSSVSLQFELFTPKYPVSVIEF